MVKQGAKIGDWVVRLKNKHGNIRIGDVKQIIAFDTKSNYFQPMFEGDIPNYSHNWDNLRLALPEEIPVEYRTSNNFLETICIW